MDRVVCMFWHPRLKFMMVRLEERRLVYYRQDLTEDEATDEDYLEELREWINENNPVQCSYCGQVWGPRGAVTRCPACWHDCR